MSRTPVRGPSADSITRRVVDEPGAQPPTPSEWHVGIEEEIRAVTRGPVPRLPSTAREADAIVPMLRRYTGQDPIVRRGEEAQESAFKSVQNPRVVVLSTHGFAFGADAKLGRKYRLSNNPLLRCGLILAGYNKSLRRKITSIGQDDGTLTGLEILGTDLRGTELVVLSACETGVGLVRSGEGVASLRQAFQLAGALRGGRIALASP